MNNEHTGITCTLTAGINYQELSDRLLKTVISAWRMIYEFQSIILSSVLHTQFASAPIPASYQLQHNAFCSIVIPFSRLVIPSSRHYLLAVSLIFHISKSVPRIIRYFLSARVPKANFSPRNLKIRSSNNSIFSYRLGFEAFKNRSNDRSACFINSFPYQTSI